MGLELDDIVTQRSLRDALAHYVGRKLKPNQAKAQAGGQ
jgi:hypothetical protein